MKLYLKTEVRLTELITAPPPAATDRSTTERL